ncbi:Sushi domain (SCR repeat) family protein [Acanthocheilonema viteae]
MIVRIILAYLLIATVISFREECAFFRENISPCPPPKLSIPYIAYNPELVNLNNLKYPHGTIAMLICPDNYYLEVEGSRWRVCKNGIWSGPFGHCKPLGQK